MLVALTNALRLACRLRHPIAARPGFARPRSGLSARSADQWRGSGEPGGSPSYEPDATRRLFVEGRVDLRHFLGLAGLVRGRRLRAGLAAEVQTERIEVDAVAAVGVDLLQRRQQLLLGGRPHVG